MKAFVLEGRGKVSFIEKEEPKLLEEHGVLITPVLVAPVPVMCIPFGRALQKEKILPWAMSVLAESRKKGER